MLRWTPVILMLLLASAFAQRVSRVAAPGIRLYAIDCGHIGVGNADSFADDGSFAGQARELVDPC